MPALLEAEPTVVSNPQSEVLTDPLASEPAEQTDLNPHYAEPNSLLTAVSSFIQRFVFVKDECVYPLLAAWTIATYLHEEFEYMGYVFAYSANPQSGKSRLLEVLDVLVSNSSGILVSPSEAVLFRTAFKSTQLLDGIDSWTNRETLRSVLNAGFRRGNTVPRMAALPDGDYHVQKFPVYSPRALAGIGEKTLSQPTRDRSFLLEMIPQKPEERRQPFRMKQIKPAADALRTTMAEWAKTHKTAVASCYERGYFPYLDGFRDRTIDVSQPLAAVTEVLHGGSVAAETSVHQLLRAITMTRKNEIDLIEDMRILSELYDLANADEPAIGTASELLGSLHEVELDEYKLSAVLRRYGFSTKSIRLADGPKYRYELEQAKIADILNRFKSNGG